MTRKYLLTAISAIVAIVLVAVLSYTWNAIHNSKSLCLANRYHIGSVKCLNKNGDIHVAAEFNELYFKRLGRLAAEPVKGSTPIFFDMPPTPPSLPINGLSIPCYIKMNK
jgi:hypothetical protein